MREPAARASSIDRSNWALVDGKADADIARDVARDPDASPIWSDADFANAAAHLPPAKLPIYIRVDPDVLEFFKAGGRGYQTRMNAVLRSYMLAARQRMSRSGKSPGKPRGR